LKGTKRGEKPRHARDLAGQAIMAASPEITFRSSHKTPDGKHEHDAEEEIVLGLDFAIRRQKMKKRFHGRPTVTGREVRRAIAKWDLKVSRGHKVVTGGTITQAAPVGALPGSNRRSHGLRTVSARSRSPAEETEERQAAQHRHRARRLRHAPRRRLGKK
jgi:hypothetical protein